MADARDVLRQRLSYAQCWEDERILVAALRPAPGTRVLSIASAGDNSLALALAGAQVDAVDLSPAQLAVTALKIASGHLDYDDALALLGVISRPDPVRLWRLLRERVDDPWRSYWDAHPDLLRAGVLRSGRFERYLALFHERVLPLVHRRSTVQRWFSLETSEERRAFWERRWDNVRWRALFHVFFSRQVMASRGRSPEHFAHVTGGIGGALMRRTQRALTALDPRDNPYAQWILTGSALRRAWPTYLTEPGHAGLVEAGARIRLVASDLTGHLGTVGGDHYDGFNLSDVFEYLDAATCEGLFAALADAGASGARLAYWNLFVPRCRPAVLSDRLRRLPALSSSLYAQDRSFVYGAFHVEEIT